MDYRLVENIFPFVASLSNQSRDQEPSALMKKVATMYSVNSFAVREDVWRSVWNKRAVKKVERVVREFKQYWWRHLTSTFISLRGSQILLILRIGEQTKNTCNAFVFMPQSILFYSVHHVGV